MGASEAGSRELRRQDLLRLLEVLPDLYAPGGTQTFPGRAMAALKRLVSSEVISYNELEPGTQQAVIETTPFDSLMFPDAEAIFLDRLVEHPLVNHYQRTGDGRARRISDFLSLSSFRQTGLYQDFYRRLGIDRQMALTLPSAPSEVIGLALNRAGLDFDDRERALVDALRPHLVAAHGHALAFTRLTLDNQRIHDILEHFQGPLAVLEESGRVVLCSDAAVRLARQYAGADTEAGRVLPAGVAAWLSATVRRRRDPDTALLAEPRLRLSGASGDLLVRLLHLPDSGWVALFEERPREASADPALTQRQEEILDLVAAGMTDKQVGAALGLSPRTVQKHLENAYARLGVGTRTAAIRRRGAPARSGQPG